MKSQWVIYTFILILFTACAPQVTVTSEVTVTLTPSPQIENTQIIPTPTKTELTIEDLAQQYFDGAIDNVDFLTFEQQKEFSIAYCDLKNTQRGENPVVWTDEAGKKFYIDPITGDFLPMDNGTTAKEQTITMYLPRVVDAEGYTHIFYEGEWVKIEGSQNIQFDDFDTFNWPDTEIVDPQWVTNPDLLGLTIPEHTYKVVKDRMTMAPIFFFNKNVGEIDIPGWDLSGALLGYVINENSPYSVLAVDITGAPSLYGDNLKADSSYTIKEGTNFIKKLEIGTLYYMMYETDQKNEFATTYPGSGGKEVTTDYQGFVPSHQSHGVLTGKIESDNLTLIQVTSLVQEGQ